MLQTQSAAVTATYMCPEAYVHECACSELANAAQQHNSTRASMGTTCKALIVRLSTHTAQQQLLLQVNQRHTQLMPWMLLCCLYCLCVSTLLGSCRYVGSWLGAPLQMDPALRRTTTILSEVAFRLTPQQLQLLLDGYINDPELQYGLTRFRRENLPHGHDYYIEPSTGECWRELQDYSLDHIIPSSLGGQHHP